MKELNTGDVCLLFDYTLEDFIKIEITKREDLNGERHYYAKAIDDGIVAYT